MIQQKPSRPFNDMYIIFKIKTLYEQLKEALNSHEAGAFPNIDNNQCE